MTILLTRDAAAFADRASEFLQARIECNILATVLTAVRAGTLAGRGELFACVLNGPGRVRGAALRTPPRPMLCSPLDLDAADGLIEAWLAEDPGLDAVNSWGSRTMKSPYVRAARSDRLC